MNSQAEGLRGTQREPDGLGNFTESGERLLRTSAVARRLGVTRRMVGYLAQKGRIATVRRGGLLFFKLSDVEAYQRSVWVPS
ncbi:MAG: helix-turn-helix domain-containing protein [Candidatus Sulfotelmatobacter sp.]